MKQEVSRPLSIKEARQFSHCESVVERSMAAFNELVGAFKKIKDGKLYREEFKTFEEYCQMKWGISRSRAYQLCDAAGVVENLSTRVDKPENEKQIRPLVGLSKSEQRAAWKKASSKAGKENRTPTAMEVEAAVEEVAPKPKNDLRSAIFKHSRPPTSNNHAPEPDLDPELKADPSLLEENKRLRARIIELETPELARSVTVKMLMTKIRDHFKGQEKEMCHVSVFLIGVESVLKKNF